MKIIIAIFNDNVKLLLVFAPKILRIYADIVQNHTLPGVFPNFWRAVYIVCTVCFLNESTVWGCYAIPFVWA